ncbi:MAG: thiol:disulfide interchange protein DsbA/DsbL [Gammaproteobacteria bacterium]|nr:thiol:disulfide interchange protein DsbA/DsbL [Gammaproteobacteria bacterium]
MTRFALVLLAAALPLSIQAAPQQADAFVEGKHYMELEEPRSTGTEADEVEVIEFFWYGCGHCYATEPHIDAWLEEKPDDVRFLRVPATLSRGWLLLARAYYTAEQLGIRNEVHRKIFDTIHGERKLPRNPDDVAALFQKIAGVDPEVFKQAFQSFPVGIKLKEADALARSYPLTGVPSFVIDGKYVTTAAMAGSYERLLDVVEMLSERALEEKGSASNAP